MLVIVPGAGLALFNHPLTFLSSSLDCDSRWLLRAKSLVYLRSLVKPVYKGGESKCLQVALWDGVFLHPWTVSWRQVCPRGQQVSLWGHLPFSLMPFLSSPNCDLLLEEPTSLEQGYNYHCLQEVCSVLSVFRQFRGTFHLLYGNLTNADNLGKHEWNWCFPSSPGLIRGWQWSAPNLRWRSSRTDLYSALLARGQSQSPLVLEISIIL